MEDNVILLVEDNPDDAKLTVRMLRRSNIDSEIIVARNGEEALHLFLDKESVRLPTLMLLDLHMPKIDGLEVLHWIRTNEWTRLLPVFMLTSSNEERDIAQSYLLGANNYLVKPLDIDQFTQAMRQIGVSWQIFQEP